MEYKYPDYPVYDDGYMPTGFAARIAMSSEAVEAFAKLDPQSRDRILDKARCASDRNEMQGIVDSLFKDPPF